MAGVTPAHPAIRKRSAFSRQQQRTDATRRKLLRAAERIFARDGFEASRLEDIAASAGYTRGAFYAHYKSKEDLLLDLLERFVADRLRRLREALAKHSDPADRWNALREQYTRMACDRRWALLSLEFKLFAIRHPQARAKMAERYRRLRDPGRELLEELLRATGRSVPIGMHAVTVALGAVANGLLIENLMDEKALPESNVPVVLSLVFDAVLGLPSKPL
jgi:AcrR family transcriptional regulator